MAIGPLMTLTNGQKGPLARESLPGGRADLRP